MEREARESAYEAFTTKLNDEGVREALAYLLHRSDYRFIGIWRFKDGKADAAVHYDRENPFELRAQEVSELATYCCYVRNSKGLFKTGNAMLDARTEGHPARAVVPTYCGVPLLDPEGNLHGTLCHYDLVPRDPDQIDLQLMMAVASRLVNGNHVPPYPSKRAAG